VDSIWRRWLRPESAVTFPEQAARFQGVGHQPAQNLLSSMDQMRLLKRRLLSRPAPFCKDQSPRIGSTMKQACQFECLATFRARGYYAGKLKGICCEVVPIKPVRRALRFLAHRSAVFPLPGLVKSFNSKTLIGATLFPPSLGRAAIRILAVACAD
jgi:hypothetical protein